MTDHEGLPDGFEYITGPVELPADYWDCLKLMAEMLQRAPSSLRDEPLAAPGKRLAADHKTRRPRPR